MGQCNGQKFWDYISIAHTIILLLHERGKIMLHYRPNGWRRLRGPLKSPLEEGETGLLRPNMWYDDGGDDDDYDDEVEEEEEE